MTQSVFPLQRIFDAERIMSCMPQDVLAGDEFRMTGQLSVTHSADSDSWFDNIGSLYDNEQKKYVRSAADFTILNKHFHGTYIEDVIKEVSKQAEEDGVFLGRIRLMLLKPKTCYSYHYDPDEFRYHIPIETNEKCFFVNNMQIEQMPDIGRLYRYRTNDYHTAVNATLKKDRIHLLFDTYEN